MNLSPGHGLMFPTALMHSPVFSVLAAFVAINTVMYAALALAKVLPKVYVSDLWTSANRRGESRGIHPSRVAPAARDADAGSLVDAA